MISVLIITTAIIGVVRGACPGQRLLPNPENPSEWGPWPTGSRTLPGTYTSRNLTVQIMYPAVVGSETGPLCRWDLREHMPPPQANKIPDDVTPMPDYDHCWEDLPLDTEHGPYPMIVFIHGTGGFRTQSAQLMTHWASRGFIVFAADYPGIRLYDMLDLVNPPLGGGPRTDQVGDTRLLLEQLRTLNDPRLAFLRGHLDFERSALIGHSAGGSALRSLTGQARVMIPMAAGGVQGQDGGQSTLVLAGLNDSVVSWVGAERGYNTGPKPKRLAVVEGLGHHFCADLCWIGADQGGIVEIAVRHGILVAEFFRFLANDGCQFEDPRFAAPPVGWRFTRYATSAAMEEVLHCNPDMTEQARRIGEVLGGVHTYREEL